MYLPCTVVFNLSLFSSFFKSDVAHFSFPFEFHVSYQPPENEYGNVNNYNKQIYGQACLRTQGGINKKNHMLVM